MPEAAVLGTADLDKKSKVKVVDRLRKHLHDARFRALAERLEELRQKHEQGLLVSIEFLKSLLELAREVVEAERTAEPAHAGEREVKKALRKTLFKYRLHQDHELFDRATATSGSTTDSVA